MLEVLLDLLDRLQVEPSIAHAVLHDAFTHGGVVGEVEAVEIGNALETMGSLILEFPSTQGTAQA
jgi:hypothetical protein